MTHDQLRTGAALVRALWEGDETARGPLSDWIEQEGGLPGMYSVNDRAIVYALRRGLRLSMEVVHDDAEHVAVVNVACEVSSRWLWLGVWPKWAWQGDYPPC
jgi:hypothetical protein